MVGAQEVEKPGALAKKRFMVSEEGTLASATPLAAGSGYCLLRLAANLGGLLA